MVEEYDQTTPRTESERPPVVIASAFKTGVLVARSLELRGLRVCLIDCDPTIEGFRSIHGESVLCPDPDIAPEAWFDFMRDLSGRLGGRPALIAASDQFVSAIGCFADQLAPHYRVSPSAPLQAELAVKEGQTRLAQRHGLPMPNTRYVVNETEADRFAQIAQYPVLMKPSQHRFWSGAPPGHVLHQVKAIRADNPAELMDNYRLAVRFSASVVLQEMVEAPDTNKRVHVAIYRRDGLRVAHLTLKELRCTRLGLPTVCEPIDDPQITAVCDQFFRAIGYRGTCEIELIWDDRDGVPKMMDINPRFSGSGDALGYAGIDQAWLVYLDLIGHTVEPVSAPPRAFRHVMLLNDMSAIRQYWQDGMLSWSDLRQSYKSPVHFWDVELRDWRLAIPTLWSSLRTTAGTLLLMLRGRRRPSQTSAHASTDAATLRQPPNSPTSSS